LLIEIRCTLRIVTQTDSVTVDRLQEHARGTGPAALRAGDPEIPAAGRGRHLVFAAPGGGEVTWVDVDALIAEASDLIPRRDRPPESAR